MSLSLYFLLYPLPSLLNLKERKSLENILKIHSRVMTLHNYESKTDAQKHNLTETPPWIHQNPNQLILKLNSARKSLQWFSRVKTWEFHHYSVEVSQSAVINRQLCAANEGPGGSWTKALLCNRRTKPALTSSQTEWIHSGVLWN